MFSELPVVALPAQPGSVSSASSVSSPAPALEPSESVAPRVIVPKYVVPAVSSTVSAILVLVLISFAYSEFESTAIPRDALISHVT